MGKVKIKKTITSILRIIITLILLFYVGSRINFYNTPTEPGFFSLLKKINLIWFIPAFILLFSRVWLFALRWKILLTAQNIHLSYNQIFRLTYLGLFFNNFMLGAMGGDIVKSAFILQETTLKTRAVISIIFDRFIGAMSLIGLCFLGVLLSPATPELKKLRLVILSITLIGLVFLIGLSCLIKSPFSARVKGFLGEIIGALKVYRNKKKVILLALGISVFMQLLLIIVNLSYAQALSINKPPFWYYFIFIPLILIFTQLPISVGGWGVGEVGYGYLLSFWGVPLSQAVIFSLLFRLSITLWSLPGALFIISRNKR